MLLSNASSPSPSPCRVGCGEHRARANVALLRLSLHVRLGRDGMQDAEELLKDKEKSSLS